MNFRIAALACLTFSSVYAEDASPPPPMPFEITYKATYDSFEAEASRYLRYDPATATYQLQTEIALELLGQRLVSVTQESQIRWEADHPVPLVYQYKQEGLNTRSRSVVFDYQAHTANYNVDGKKGTLALNGPVFDDLSSHLAMREQLIAGNKELEVEVLDKDTIKTYRYQVGDEAELNTALGKFTAIKLTRIRDDNPKRKTEIWLAKDYDFLLLKLVQEEPSNDTIKLDIIKASFNGANLRPG